VVFRRENSLANQTIILRFSAIQKAPPTNNRVAAATSFISLHNKTGQLEQTTTGVEGKDYEINRTKFRVKQH
jgi:hypothetical protein